MRVPVLLLLRFHVFVIDIDNLTGKRSARTRRVKLATHRWCLTDQTHPNLEMGDNEKRHLLLGGLLPALLANFVEEIFKNKI